MAVPTVPPARGTLANTTACTASPSPSTPRVRSAGSANTTPATAAPTMPVSSASGKGQWNCPTAMRAANSAPRPAKAYWASDNCPA